MHHQLHIPFAFVIIIAAVFPASALAQESAQHGRVQRHFSAEDAGVKSRVTIPREVMEILGEDDMVKSQMENEEPRPPQVPQSWFSASKIRLGPTKANDLIVQATGPLAGVNVVVFWIFIHTHEDEWKLALMVPAHDFIVTQTRVNKYRNLEANAMTCCAITTARFRFDGRVYKRYFAETKEIK